MLSNYCRFLIDAIETADVIVELLREYSQGHVIIQQKKKRVNTSKAGIKKKKDKTPKEGKKSAKKETETSETVLPKEEGQEEKEDRETEDKPPVEVESQTSMDEETKKV